MPRAISQTSTYTDRLVKLIPAEWVGAYIAIKGILDSAQSNVQTVSWGIVLVLLILLPFYLRYTLAVQSARQIGVTTVSFLVWVFSVGGDHVGALSWYEPYQGSIALILWTLMVPVIIGQHGCDSRPERGTATQGRNQIATA